MNEQITIGLAAALLIGCSRSGRGGPPQRDAGANPGFGGSGFGGSGFGGSGFGGSGSVAAEATGSRRQPRSRRCERPAGHGRSGQ